MGSVGVARGCASVSPHTSVTCQCPQYPLPLEEPPCRGATCQDLDVHITVDFTCSCRHPLNDPCSFSWYVKNVDDDVEIDSGTFDSTELPYGAFHKEYIKDTTHSGDTIEAKLTRSGGDADYPLIISLSVNRRYEVV